MDSEADEQNMAQMMGFSSFGTQDHPNKKRRYNPNADAAGIIKEAPLASTGSNSTPLGARTSAKTDEIDLESEEDGGDGGAPVEAAATSESSQAQVHGLPQRPATGLGFAGGSGREGHGRGFSGQMSGNRETGGAPWYVDYYDNLSNRNPWERLEKEIDLQPKGTWIAHDGQTTGAP